MNRQEIFKDYTTATFKLPNPFSAWPYFILIVAAFLVSTTKLSSQSLEQKEASWDHSSTLTSYEHIARGQTLSKRNIN